MAGSARRPTQTSTPALRHSPDGVKRGQAEHERVALAAVSAFSQPSGQEFLKYLRSRTIDMVNGPVVEPNALMHLEGQRFVVGLIEEWIAEGHKVKTNG